MYDPNHQSGNSNTEYLSNRVAFETRDEVMVNVKTPNASKLTSAFVPPKLGNPLSKKSRRPRIKPEIAYDIAKDVLDHTENIKVTELIVIKHHPVTSGSKFISVLCTKGFSTNNHLGWAHSIDPLKIPNRFLPDVNNLDIYCRSCKKNLFSQREYYIYIPLFLNI